MAARIHLDRPLAVGDAFELPAAQSRHVQVLRLQPGAPLRLFNGAGGEWQAHIVRIGRSSVDVEIDACLAVDRELSRHVTLALGMPANERMDAFVEKATELGVAAIQPLVSERSVLRLAGERAARRLAHWRGVAIAASEQSGRTRVPEIREVRPLDDWLVALRASAPDLSRRLVLSPAAARWDGATAGAAGTPLVVLSGPEGGFSAAEEDRARACGFEAVSLGARLLRADTAPLAALAWCLFEPRPEGPG